MDASIADKTDEYKAALTEYAACAAQENFDKQQTIKARTRLNIAEENLRALRYDINDLALAKEKQSI